MNQPLAPPRKKGSALLLTLLVVSLMLVLVLALTALVRMKLREVNLRGEQMTAMQNARLGLELAISELQRLAGPDQRITATSAILDPNPDTTAIESTAVGGYAGVRQPHWTGVWTASPNGILTRQSGFDAHPVTGKSTTNPKGQPAWLIGANFGLNPGDAGYRSPLDTPTPFDPLNEVWLLHHPSNPDTPTSPGFPLTDPRRVASRVREVSSGGGIPVRFAYHVMDEGVKVPLAGVDPHADSAPDSPMRLTTQRNALEKTQALAGLPPAVFPRLSSLLTLGQINLLQAGAVDPGKMHDFALINFGVQSDTANGGLKRDLSVAFDMPDALFNASPLFSNSGLQRVDGSALRNGANDSWLGVNIEETHTFAPIYLAPMRRRNPAHTDENTIWAPAWHLLRDYARLHLPLAQNPSGVIGTDGDVPVYRARGFSLGPQPAPGDERIEEYKRSRRHSVSLWNNTSSSARSTNYIADSVPYFQESASAPPHLIRPTRGHLAPVVTKFVMRWAVRVDDERQTNDPAARRRLTLVFQPSFLVWNPYNVTLEVDAINLRSRPDSGTEFLIETEVESWVAGRHYRRFQEVVHNAQVYRYLKTYSACTQEPGVAPPPATEAEWELLAPATARTAHGRVWGMAALTNWAMILNANRESLFVLVSAGTQVDPVGNQIQSFEPIRFRPGEVKFFGPRRNQLEDGHDPAYIFNNRRQFLLQEGTFHPSSGIVYNRIRTHPNNHELNLSGNDGEVLLEANREFRISMGSWNMQSRPLSVDGVKVFHDFYGSIPYDSPTARHWGNTPQNQWSREVGNDGNSLYYMLGQRRSGGMNGRNVFNWEVTDNATFVPTDVVDDHFHIRFRYTYNHHWKGTPPPITQRAMVYPRTPLAGFTIGTIGQHEQYLKAGEDGTENPARIFANFNPRYGTVSPLHAFGYSDTHHFVQLLNEETNISPNLSPIPQVNGKGFYGASYDSGVGEQHVLLYDIPREPLRSLGQLQHAPFYAMAETPAYTIGNSEVPPTVASNDEFSGLIRDDYHSINASAGNINLDASWLANEALFDGFFFSSLTPWFDPALTQDWWNGVRPAPSSRMVPYVGGHDGPPDLTQADGYRRSAAALLTRGSFNVNSTSVEAWKSLIASLSGASVGRLGGIDRNHMDYEANQNSPLPRAHVQLGVENESFVGHRTLTDAELQQLAEEIVRQVKLRGPFLSLSDFVNRRLVNPGNDMGGRAIAETGRKGALQAAIDRTSLNASFQTFDASRLAVVSPDLSRFKDQEAWAGTDNGRKMMAHASGFLTQGDILQAIAPALSARSDTFRIRFYGDVKGTGGVVRARAYGEALVQRVPNYVDPADAPDTRPYRGSNGMDQDNLQRISPFPLAAGNTLTLDGPKYQGGAITNIGIQSNLRPVNAAFGRRFEVVSFRWLNPDEI